ncbi:MAG: helix-turn-helix transcriptional regulator [Phycisphaeraceae bacterium]|nr:helix-turn-helix transcriptional regulator [Phycisphaerales bacterium]MCB9859021.1 helix-turn-helix transcriptional regulator [Phycisphaeraceae bacterium]
MDTTQLHERLIAAAGGRTYRHLSELTGTNSETVRRYMNGQSPSAEFLQALCVSLGISGTWLLTGSGPMRSEDLKGDALRMADPSDLLGAMAATVEGMLDRVSRLETYVQTLETRVRASKAAAGNGSVASLEAMDPSRNAGVNHSATIKELSTGTEQTHAEAAQRAKHIARSIKGTQSGRSRPSAD